MNEIEEQTDKKEQDCETKNKNESNNRDKNIQLIKILSTAALSVALISWYATANGLHQYVFERLWQAYVISAAIQGPLFALSIEGVPLFFSFKTHKISKRVGLVFVWCFLLVTSSTFSYVFISSQVYTDQLLREDAHRILSKDCLLKNYKLSSEADKLLNGTENSSGIIKDLNNYIEKLAILKDGIDLKDKNDITNHLKETLLQYAYSHTSKPNTIIEGCIDTTSLYLYFEKIITGKYSSENMEETKNECVSLKNSINSEIKSKNTQKKSKTKERNGYQNRLKGYTNTSDDAYINLRDLLSDTVTKISDLQQDISNLQKEKGIIDSVQNMLDSIEKSLESTLYSNVIALQAEMNAEKIDIEEVEKISKQIYNALLDNSSKIDSNDVRLTNYPDFKANLKKYSTIVKAKKSIIKEIKELYKIKSINEYYDNIEKSDSKDNTEYDRIINLVDWRGDWQKHLNSLKSSAKKLQSGGLEQEKLEDIIIEIDNNERIYLSNINAFEKAWSLLFNIYVQYPYKILLIFSCIFAFAFDLFSVLMSILIYSFRKKKD